MNDSKCISLINYVNLENIINFEYSENFPNSGFTSLIFPIRKALGPLPKIAEKIPVFFHYFIFICFRPGKH